MMPQPQSKAVKHASPSAGPSARIARASLALVAWVCLVAQPIWAQGCAMCYQSAAASGAQGREALRHGIAVLFLPAASLFFGIFGLLYYRRNKSR
ncbi:MAG TPA: hypothetical protein VN661_02255 [Candidatus Acidoferrales bacterium]|nr:hypothetical protein [Candidatus Acidoferrales bacterium]